MFARAGGCDRVHFHGDLQIQAGAFSTFANGKRKYQQAAAYILMLNTGLRTGELLGLLNSDIDLERRVLHLERGVKEVWRRMVCKPNQAVT